MTTARKYVKPSKSTQNGETTSMSILNSNVK